MNAKQHEIVDTKASTALTLFDPIRVEIENIKEHSNSLVFEYETPSGNRAARSHVFSLRKVKARIAEAHKEAKAEALAVGQAIDKYKRDLTAEVDGMIELHDKPLRDIEERAAKVKAEAEAKVQAAKEAEEKRIKEEQEIRQREIERKESELKAKEAELQRKEREANIAREAEERAKKEAEARIQHEREMAERRIAEERERTQRLLAEEKAKAEYERQKVADEAKRQERDAVAAREAAEKAEAIRVADRKHRLEVETSVIDSLVVVCGCSLKAARSITDAISNGKIKNTSINY